ncbi:MAG: hypothetical protein AAB316_01940, partial [Bacteroidota bacterium]
DRATGHFRNYPFTRKLKPSTAPVTGLFFDRAGRLWAGVAYNGVVQLDVKTGSFKQFDLVTAENSPHLNAEDLSAYNTGYRFYQDEQGKLWVTNPGDFYVFDPETGTARPWRPLKKLPAGAFFAEQASCILPDGELLWTGGWESGLRSIYRKTGERRQFFFYPENVPAPGKNIVYDLTAKSLNEIWIGTHDRGLGIFNKKTEQFFWFADHPEQVIGGLPPQVVGGIVPDNQGNSWAAADGKLVRMRLKDRHFRRHEVAADRKQSFIVSQLLEDRERRFFFIGTQYADGLHVVEKKTGKEQVLGFYAPPMESGALLVMDLLQARDGKIWVLTHHSILQFNPDTRRLETPVQPQIYSQEKVSNFYTELAEDSLGNLWLGTAHLGLLRFDPRTGQSEQFLPDENDPHTIATNIVGSVEVDGRGRTWFGSRGKTAYGYYLPGERKFEFLDAEGKFTSDRATLRLNSFFAASNGDIWACTEGGILHFDCSGERPVCEKNTP